MAVIPGTQFTELAPPAQTGQTYWSPSLASTGEEQKIAASLERFGGAIAAYALNTIRQEMALEYSEKERMIDERGWAARNAVTGDEEADGKLWEKFQEDAQLIAGSSKYRDVNEELVKYINRVSPNWEQGIYTASLKKRRENCEDQFNVEYYAALEKGQFDIADKRRDEALKLGIITKAKHEELKKNAPVESQILIAEKLAELGNYTAAQSEIENIDLSTLSKPQRLRIKNLVRISQEQRDIKHDTNGRNFLARLWDDNPNNQPTPQEVADAIRPENDLITESMGKYLMDNLGDTSAKETDLNKLTIVNDAILNYQMSPSFTNKQEALDIIYENSKYLTKADGKSKLNELYSEISKVDAAERREAYSNMAQLLGGRPSLENLFDFNFDNYDQKTAWIKAKILWDEKVKKARDEKKPLDSYQKRIAAYEIVQQIKEEVNAGVPILPLLETTKKEEIKVTFAPEGTSAGYIMGKSWGTHNGTGKVILTIEGVRALVKKYNGDEEKIRKFVERQGYIIPEI